MITYSTVLVTFFITNQNNISILPSKKKEKLYDWSFMKKRPKPLIGFEPMTYALPWRYSTTELKGPI